MANNRKFRILHSVGKPIEYILFEVVCILSIGLMGFWIIYGFIVGFTTTMLTIYIAALVGFVVAYFAHIRGFNFGITSSLFYFFCALLLILGWFPSGGTTGAIMHPFFLVFVTGLLVLDSKRFLVYSVLMILIATSASLIEYFQPYLVSPYTDSSRRVLDIFVSNIIILTAAGICIFVFKKAFKHDRNKIRGLVKTLEQQKRKAESADQAKSQFLATISHEMRTPLNGILGIADLLYKSELDDEQKQLVLNLISSSEMLHSLVSDVLDLTQIEDNKLVLHEADFDLKYEIENIKSIFVDRIKREDKDVELVFDLDDKIDRIIVGDVVRLKQVIINLVNNALKFTEKGMVKVSAQLVEKKDDIAKINVSVRDTGIGIPKDQLKKLFNKFTKINTPQHNRKDGTGLGLVITKNIVHAMGGEVRVSSEFGIGSVFSFVAPFKVSKNQKFQKVVEEFNDLSDYHLKVLVAEDYEINRLVAQKTLQNLGVETVEMAIDGMEAYEKAVIGNHDFILMDVKMPELDGLGATELILDKFKRDNRKPPIIIAITANAMKEDVDACLEVGMSHFVSKPFNQKSLYQAFKKFLNEN